VGHLTRSLSIARELNDKKDIAESLRSLAVIMMTLGKYETATRYQKEGLSLYEALGDQKGIMKALRGLGLISQLSGDFEQALTYHEQSLTLAREMSDLRGIAFALNNLGNIGLATQNYEDAERYQNQSLQIFKQIGDRHGVAIALGDLAYIRWTEGQEENAQMLFCEAINEAFNIDALPIGLSLILKLTRLLLEKDERERGIKLLGFVIDHPALTPRDKQEARALLEKLKTEFAPALVASTLGRGKQMTIDEVLAIVDNQR
jgi:tetratricopeptide (TPR) repeat protein